jgi:hypothetical protein
MVTTTTARPTVTRLLLACGPVYGVLSVVANDVVAAALLPGYDPLSQAISELSAVGAQSRPFLIAVTAVWTGLLAGFGLGVRRAADDRRALRVTGNLLIAHAVVGLLWLPFPMTARADMVPGPMAVNDVGHLVLTAATAVFVTAEVVSSAMAFGRGFRIYAAVTVGTALGFGALTGVLTIGIESGAPTPWMGLAERVSIGAWLVWMAVLAVRLLAPSRRASRAAVAADAAQQAP